jgi:hypothetical protein
VNVSGLVKSAFFIFDPWCGEAEKRGLLFESDVRGANERVQGVEEISIDCHDSLKDTTLSLRMIERVEKIY